MSERSGGSGRGMGTDLRGPVHAITGIECYLPDTRYPRPHHSLTGESWHGGLCTQCAGAGVHADTICSRCNGAAFEPLALPDSGSYPPG